eukprot:jgi/Chlat1/3964/Chrsp26S04223
MALFHAINCAALAFMPHVVYYKATPLAEYDARGSCFKAGLVYVFTALIKLVCVATFLQASDIGVYDINQEFGKAMIGLLDVVGLYFALTQVSYHSMSQSLRFQAVGLGWASAEALMQGLGPLTFAVRQQEFTWDYVHQALQTNVNLIITLSLATVGACAWSRKNRQAALAPVLYTLILIHAFLPSSFTYLRMVLGFSNTSLLAVEFATAAVLALASWRMYLLCYT